MKKINIIDPSNDFELVLCKPNRSEIGILSIAKITSIKGVIDDIDTITFDISDTYQDNYTKLNMHYNLYDEIHEERLVKLNGDYFVIKNISEDKGDINTKNVTIYSLEQKLNRINISLEDVGIVLVGEDAEENDIAISNLLYSETGWDIGHVDDDVRFDVVEGENKPKYRWQDSISENWYDFLTKTISEIFACIVVFDTKNKLVNFYSLDKYGENIGLYLCRDNYIKSIGKQSNTDNIVTRLSLFGKDEIDVRSVNPLGTDWIEDYTYFIENEDMSDELVNALNKHKIVVEENQSLWEELSTEKTSKQNELRKFNSDFYALCEKIKVLITQRNVYEEGSDDWNRINDVIDEENSNKTKLEDKIRAYEMDIKRLNERIDIINKQMDRKFATDREGILIFSKDLLMELNEFLYYDEYSNTSYLTPLDLMNGGIRELSRRCIPTIEYTMDSVNFLSRSYNHDDIRFKGGLRLGDIIILYDDKNDVETLLYFVSYEYNPFDNTLEITLSNKKTKINDTKSIGDYLKQAKRSKQFVDKKAYIFNQVKYNKI